MTYEDFVTLGFIYFHGGYKYGNKENNLAYSPLNGWFKNGVKIDDFNTIEEVEQEINSWK